MIAEIGLGMLWLAAGLAIIQSVLGAVGLAQANRPDLGNAVRPVAVAQAILIVLSFLCLIYVFVVSDMSVKLVAANSHSDKPMLYKVSGAWGNHEGSMLLWVTVLAMAGAGIAIAERRVRRDTLIATLMAQGILALGFYAFLLFSSNPFERLNPAPPNGQGLNPLLQDPGLAFHPPTLYVGYVGMSAAFSFAVGALLTHHHADHVGGLATFRAALGLPIWGHPKLGDRLGLTLDRALSEGETLVLDGPTPTAWDVLFTPGHAADHLCLHERSLGALVLGDMVASVGTILIAPGDGDMADSFGADVALATGELRKVLDDVIAALGGEVVVTQEGGGE